MEYLHAKVSPSVQSTGGLAKITLTGIYFQIEITLTEIYNIPKQSANELPKLPPQKFPNNLQMNSQNCSRKHKLPVQTYPPPSNSTSPSWTWKITHPMCDKTTFQLWTGKINLTIQYKSTFQPWTRKKLPKYKSTFRGWTLCSTMQLAATRKKNFGCKGSPQEYNPQNELIFPGWKLCLPSILSQMKEWTWMEAWW